MSAPVLKLEEFGVAYGPRTVLRSVCAEVPASGCTVLLGPSGTGKSTLLRTLAGYNRCVPELRSWGRALYAAAPCSVDHHPALVVQNSRLLLANVLENLVCMLPKRAAMTRAMQIDTILPLLAACGQVGLMERLHEQVVALPVGLQRIVAILREAAAGPLLLMVDEPTAGLAPAEAGLVLQVVAQVARRCAVLLVLHNLQEARRVGENVILLSAGIVQEARPVPDFFAAPRTESGRLFLATGSCPEPAAAPAAAPRPPHASADAAASASCGPRGFVWLLPGRLAGTPWPGVVHGADYDLQALRNVGITHLVSLTEEPFDPLVAARHGIGCIASPVPDMHPPTVPQALALCSRIDRLLGSGKVVAVHCRAGLGRTGTVLAAYWLWRGRGELSAPRALEDVRRLEPGWVQSDAQVRFIEQFALVISNTPDAHRDFDDPAAAMDVAVPPPYDDPSATNKETIR